MSTRRAIVVYFCIPKEVGGGCILLLEDNNILFFIRIPEITKGLTYVCNNSQTNFQSVSTAKSTFLSQCLVSTYDARSTCMENHNH